MIQDHTAPTHVKAVTIIAIIAILNLAWRPANAALIMPSITEFYWSYSIKFDL